METTILSKSVPQAYALSGIEETAKPDVSRRPKRFRAAIWEHYDAVIMAEG